VYSGRECLKKPNYSAPKKFTFVERLSLAFGCLGPKLLLELLLVVSVFGFGADVRCGLPCPCLIGAVEALGLAQNQQYFRLNFIPINFSISRKKTVSSGLNKILLLH
jgi:hypothetical protein